MKGEQGRHKSAWPDTARHFSEHGKQQQTVQEMKKQAGHVMHTRIHFEKLNIQHVRQPG